MLWPSRIFDPKISTTAISCKLVETGDQYLAIEGPEIETTFENFERVLQALRGSLRISPPESGVDARVIEELRAGSECGTRFSRSNCARFPD